MASYAVAHNPRSAISFNESCSRLRRTDHWARAGRQGRRWRRSPRTAGGEAVVLLEKDYIISRFHIGESLLPGKSVELFDRLGVKRSGCEDRHAEVRHRVRPASISDRAKLRRLLRRLGSFQGLGLAGPRSELDELLFRHAGKQGALTLVEGAKVRQVDLSSGPRVLLFRRFFSRRRDTHLAHPFRPSMQVAVTHSSRTSSRASRKTANTTARRCSATFAMPAGSRANVRATSVSVGSSTAGSGLFHWPTARPSVGAGLLGDYLKARDKPLKEYFLDTIAMCPELNDTA